MGAYGVGLDAVSHGRARGDGALSQWTSVVKLRVLLSVSWHLEMHTMPVKAGIVRLRGFRASVVLDVDNDVIIIPCLDARTEDGM